MNGTRKRKNKRKAFVIPFVSSPSISCLRDDPIFILGYGRSGTTLLSSLISAHPEIAIAPESPVHPLHDIFRLTKALWESQLLAESFPEFELLETYLRECVRMYPKYALAWYLASWAAIYKKHSARWGDKYTGNWRYMGRLIAWYPKAQFINLVRDPRDVVSSILDAFPKQRKVPNFLLPAHFNLSWRWRKAYRTVSKYRRRLGSERYIQVRYEDLVSHTEQTVRQLCTFLDVSYNDDMLSTQVVLANRAVPERTHAEVKKPPHCKRIGRWKANLSGNQATDIAHLCSLEIQELGYEQGKKISAMRRFQLGLLSVFCQVGWCLIKNWKRIVGKF